MESRSQHVDKDKQAHQTLRQVEAFTHVSTQVQSLCVDRSLTVELRTEELRLAVESLQAALTQMQLKQQELQEKIQEHDKVLLKLPRRPNAGRAGLDEQQTKNEKTQDGDHERVDEVAEEIVDASCEQDGDGSMAPVASLYNFLMQMFFDSNRLGNRLCCVLSILTLLFLQLVLSEAFFDVSNLQMNMGFEQRVITETGDVVPIAWANQIPQSFYYGPQKAPEEDAFFYNFLAAGFPRVVTLDETTPGTPWIILISGFFGVLLLCLNIRSDIEEALCSPMATSSDPLFAKMLSWFVRLVRVLILPFLIGKGAAIQLGTSITAMDVVMNSLAATFILEVDDYLYQMLVPADWKLQYESQTVPHRAGLAKPRAILQMSIQFSRMAFIVDLLLLEIRFFVYRLAHPFHVVDAWEFWFGVFLEDRFDFLMNTPLAMMDPLFTPMRGIIFIIHEQSVSSHRRSYAMSAAYVLFRLIWDWWAAGVLYWCLLDNAFGYSEVVEDPNTQAGKCLQEATDPKSTCFALSRGNATFYSTR